GDISGWQDALGASGSLKFYGQHVGQTGAGQTLLAGIAALHGQDVEDNQGSTGQGSGPTSPSIGHGSGRDPNSSAGNTAHLTNVILIDHNLQDSETLLAAVNPDAQVFLYDSAHDSAADVLGRVTDWAQTNHEE